MVADMKPDAKEEYRRIPWIWRVAVAAGTGGVAGTAVAGAAAGGVAAGAA